ncbi:MAG TPA: hypothetical protein VIJ96_01665 [Acidothermaceae bacterium]
MIISRPDSSAFAKATSSTSSGIGFGLPAGTAIGGSLAAGLASMRPSSTAQPKNDRSDDLALLRVSALHSVRSRTATRSPSVTVHGGGNDSAARSTW